MSEKTESEQTKPKCPCCGGSDFVKGDMGVMRLTFNKQNIGLFESGEDVRGRKCTTCGNIQLFARAKK